MSEFKVGDRVRHKASGYVGTIVSGNDADGYSVHYPCDDEEYFVHKNEIDFVDSKGAFLQRLQELLREFDAEIVASVWRKDATTTKPLMQIDIEGQKSMIYENTLHNDYVFVNADSIMDFDKE